MTARRWRRDARWAASVFSVMTVGILRGRGNGRDQFGRDCAFAQPLIWIQTLPRGVPGRAIHPPRSHRARAMVRRYLSCGRRDEGEGRIRITRRGRIAGSQNDRQVAEKALHAKTKIKLTPTFPRPTRAVWGARAQAASVNKLCLDSRKL